MLEPGLYPHGPATVELRETHTSWVFLAGERAYKVKKPVRFPFLDYGTLERRREMCREEVRLNRRLAPHIYLRVAAIVRSAGRYALAAADEPAAVEYAVEMRRVSEDRSLEALASSGALEPGHVVAVAELLARFHADAPLAPHERRTPEALTAPLWENLDTLRDAGAGGLVREALDSAHGFTRGFVGARRDELVARARRGLVRDCHGDLRAEHAIVPADAPPYVYDCVEFNPALRQIDVSADLGFLVMDLARLGHDEMATRLIAAYRDAGGDPGDDQLLCFHASYRAWVRAKVALLRAAELSPKDDERAERRAEARGLFHLGRRFAWRARRPLVLVICGVAGSGKTTLARELASLAGLAHLSSDVTRKRLAGLAPGDRAPAELYSPELTSRTYRQMGLEAGGALDREGGAIVDATFHRRDARAAFLEALGEVGAPVVFVECRAATGTLLARVRERETDPGSASDANAAIVERQLTELEPLEEVREDRRAMLETDLPADRLTARVEELVDARIWPPAP